MTHAENITEKSVSFVKMQATGNDFVVIDARHRFSFDLRSFALHATDRHFGIGADGVIFLRPSMRAEFLMTYFNRDGSETTCGNGLRCLARFIYQGGLVGPEQREFEIETSAGVVRVHVYGSGDLVKVEVGTPLFEGKQIPTAKPGKHLGVPLSVLGETQTIYALGMGNPHCVLFVADLEQVNVQALGGELETHAFFPERTNVEFVQVIDSDHLKMRVWERGVGETLSCGTGACAVVVASVCAGRSKREVVLTTRGGELKVLWDEKSDKVSLIGPAETVYTGEVRLSNLFRH